MTGQSLTYYTKNLKLLFSEQITVFVSSTQKRVHYWFQHIPLWILIKLTQSYSELYSKFLGFQKWQDMCTGRPCKVSHFKQSSEKFILHYKCSHYMKCWHEKNLYRCWQFNSWIANTYTFDKYLYMLVVLLVLARCWQINWPYIHILGRFISTWVVNRLVYCLL